VCHPRPGGPEPNHLGVVEVDPVRHPHVAVDPPEVVEQIHGAPAEPIEHVAFLVDRLGQVGVQPEAVQRASAADSRMSSGVTLNGLHGATVTTTRSPS